MAWIVRRVVNLYFLGALTLSFTHIITTATKLHTTGWQVWAWPFMIDGIALIGMVMRMDRWSDRTNKIGFRVQLVSGSMSLAANVYAGDTVGNVITGIGAVGLFIFAEWLSGQLETRAEAEAKAETAELEMIASLPSPEDIAAEKRREAARKAAATRRRNRRAAERTRKAQEAALEALVAG